MLKQLLPVLEHTIRTKEIIKKLQHVACKYTNKVQGFYSYICNDVYTLILIKQTGLNKRAVISVEATGLY